MFARHRALVVLTGVLLAAAACEKGLTSTDYQIYNIKRMKELNGAWMRQIADSGLAYDMSLADFHFVPHTAELNGTGAARLDRMAAYLTTYGGTVRYQSYAKDEALVGQRITHVQEYLALAGCDMERVSVTLALSGGRGMPGREAIEVKERGTAKPDAQAASGMTFMPTGNQ